MIRALPRQLRPPPWSEWRSWRTGGLGEDRRHLSVGGGVVDSRAGDPGHGPNDRNRWSGWADGPCVRCSEVAADGGGLFRPFHWWATPHSRAEVLNFFGRGE